MMADDPVTRRLCGMLLMMEKAIERRDANVERELTIKVNYVLGNGSAFGGGGSCGRKR